MRSSAKPCMPVARRANQAPLRGAVKSNKGNSSRGCHTCQRSKAPNSKKASHLEEGAGHYGIFAGKSWRNNIRPLVLEFIDANSAAPAKHQTAAE